MPSSQLRHNGSRRILIIEDDADSAEMLRVFFEINGHQVETAPDGESGLAEAYQRRPDIVVCDITLNGGIDGNEVAREIRSSPELGSVLLVALSGHGRVEDKERSKRAGFDIHLVKPIEHDKLLRLIAEIPKT
jgi:CheY-like chemotaxis protein